jgi:myo-inositol-1(or 4)-monophosphatase
MTDADQLLQGVVDVARRAGDFISRERTTFGYARVEQKGLNDLVSDVDRGSEKIIVEGLRALLPEAGFLVEEGTAREEKRFNWIVDPLDGTTNFVHGIPCYAVSIALEEAGHITMGVVLEVARSECFYARRGSGAFLNGDRIRVSDRQSLSESLIATGFPVNNFSRLEPFLGCIGEFMRKTHGVRRVGAAAADLCYLACGRFDGFFEYNLNAWDVAAGALIVEEAGGTVSDFSGGGNWLFGREIACSNGHIREDFMRIIRERFDPSASAPRPGGEGKQDGDAGGAKASAAS